MLTRNKVPHQFTTTAGIDWLVGKFKAYMLLRERLLSDTSILRDKLDVAQPDLSNGASGSHDMHHDTVPNRLCMCVTVHVTVTDVLVSACAWHSMSAAGVSTASRYQNERQCTLSAC